MIGSDSQSTTLSAGGPVRQPTKKIKIFGGSILWAGSGGVGFIQNVERVIGRIPKEVKNSGIDELSMHLINCIHPIRRDSLQRIRGLYGKDGEKDASSAGFLFAEYKGGQPKILHISQDLHDEQLQEYSFGVIGIGDTFAYTILKNFQPYIKEFPCEMGKFLVYKVIRDAIETGAYGLGLPVDIWTITEKKGDKKKISFVYNLKEEEIKAIEDAYIILKEAEIEKFTEICSKSKK